MTDIPERKVDDLYKPLEGLIGDVVQGVPLQVELYIVVNTGST